MIVTNEFVKKLGQLGLNSYEAKLWTALLSRGVSTAGELSDIANVPRSRSYDVLESLEKKGFIIQKLGKPIKYVALPPEEVLERVKKQIKQDAETKASQMEELRGSDILNELSTLHTQGIEMVEPSDMTGALRNRDSLYEQLALLIREAEEEVLLVSTPKELNRIIETLEREISKAKERGIEFKAITSGHVETDLVTCHVTDKIDGRFAIADKKQIMFMLLPDDGVHPSYDVGIWANAPYFAAAIADVFDIAFPVLKET